MMLLAEMANPSRRSLLLNETAFIESSPRDNNEVDGLHCLGESPRKSQTISMIPCSPSEEEEIPHKPPLPLEVCRHLLSDGRFPAPCVAVDPEDVRVVAEDKAAVGPCANRLRDAHPSSREAGRVRR